MASKPDSTVRTLIRLVGFGNSRSCHLLTTRHLLSARRVGGWRREVDGDLLAIRRAISKSSPRVLSRQTLSDPGYPGRALISHCHGWVLDLVGTIMADPRLELNDGTCRVTQGQD